jgi:uncharacterized membrane protein HdeD (DUF308 family)
MTQPPGPPPGYGPPGHPAGPSPSRTLPLLLGSLLGGVDVVVTTLLGVAVGGGANTPWLSSLGPAIGLLVPIVLLFSPATRWWGVGMLLGYFVTLIVLAGACVALLSSLGG